MNACTITLRRRWPFALTLADSYLANHPGATFSILVIDSESGEIPAREGISVLGPPELGISARDLHSMALMWPFGELRAALIPRLLSYLTLDAGAAQIYFADDTKIFRPVIDLERFAKEFGLVVARRALSPLPADTRTPDHSDLLAAGLYDEGFAAVSADCIDLLDWWIGAASVDTFVMSGGRAACRCVLQAAPSYFSYHVVQDPGFGVSYWNLGGRRIVKSAEDYRVGDNPIQTVRFEGFDPEKPYLLGPQGTKPRVLLSERPDIADLVLEYRRDLEERGMEQASNLPYRFSRVAAGVSVDDRIRSVYRKALKQAGEGRDKTPPDPFGDSRRFIEWLNTPDASGRAPLVSRYLLELYDERVDLHLAFPGLSNAGAAKFLDWVVRYGESEGGIPPALAADAGRLVEKAKPDERLKKSRPPVLDLPDGVNIAGYFTAELGVGEMARLILLAFQRTSVPFSTYAYQGGFSRQHHPFRPIGEEFAYNTNLICVNADQLSQFVMDTGPRLVEGRYNIGLWWWEVDVLPRNMATAAHFLEEIWVGTEHVAGAVRAATDKPVYVIPPAIRPITTPPIDRKAMQMPDGFMFLFTFDFLSVEERKNPGGVIEAFKRAFPETRPGGPVLVIKSINGDLRSLEKLKMAAHPRSDIRIIDGYLPPQSQDALVAACDCYVSLHRSEGYGLGMAEAMALGRPIIATGYSGNMAFLNEDNSYLVRYQLVPVPPGSGPYPQGARWAEPDLDHAAQLMRKVWENPQEAAGRGIQGQREALTLHTPERTAEFIAERMREILETQRRRREYEELQLRGGTRLTLLREGLRGFIKGPIPPR